MSRSQRIRVNKDSTSADSRLHVPGERGRRCNTVVAGSHRAPVYLRTYHQAGVSRTVDEALVLLERFWKMFDVEDEVVDFVNRWNTELPSPGDQFENLIPSRHAIEYKGVEFI